MAAGLSIKKENISVFRKKINENCHLKEEDFYEKIQIDVELPMSYVTKDFLKELNRLEPFGMGNQKPVFAQKNITFLSMNAMGKNKDMAKFWVEDEKKQRFYLVLFRKLENFLESVENKYGKTAVDSLKMGKNNLGKIKMHIIYYPGINTYMGKEELQFILQEWI